MCHFSGGKARQDPRNRSYLGLVQRSIAEKGAWLAKLAMCYTLLARSIHEDALQSLQTGGGAARLRSLVCALMNRPG
ncbi:MAG: hypothetical protein ACI9HE_002419 [Planctomycetota bacterium]|jgi:hypothetical protein